MRKTIHRLLGAALSLALLCSTAAAFAESKYVSIKDILSNAPERWTYEVTSQKGDDVKIDTPITILRLKWKLLITSPIVWCCITPTPDWEKVDEDSPLHDVSVGSISYEDAPETLLFQLRSAFPALQERDFECFYQATYANADRSDGFYSVNYYPLYHGIAYLIGQCFWGEAKGESVGDLPSVPFNGTYGSLRTTDQYTANVSAPKELGMDVEDIPLLPLDDILEVFKQRAKDGYIYSLSEIRLGYMAFIDPDKKGEEFVLMPVWAGRGITRSYLSNPFFPQPSDEAKEDAGFHSSVNVVVNAQTGEAYEFFYDTSPDRRHVPKIITWDDVK